MNDVLYQRGANGRIAERQCALSLAEHLTRQGVSCLNDLSVLTAGLDRALAQYTSDLTRTQMRRAQAQGEALGAYLANAIVHEPHLLGLPDRGIDVRESQVSVIPVGNATNSGSSADILIAFAEPGALVRHLAVSLKAYRADASSLGSKGAEASLRRLFLVPGQDPQPEFGAKLELLRDAIKDYKAVAKNFYTSSDEGRAFLDAYELRKGTRTVSNPLRRKELGAYFASVRDHVSEHNLARLFTEAYSAGLDTLHDEGSRERFYDGMRFLLGMELNVVVLNAVADDSGDTIRVVNSLTDTKYGRINYLLDVGCTVDLTSQPKSGGITVMLSHEGITSRDLRLAMWKDGTIQFQLVSRGSVPNA